MILIISKMSTGERVINGDSERFIQIKNNASFSFGHNLWFKHGKESEETFSYLGLFRPAALFQYAPPSCYSVTSHLGWLKCWVQQTNWRRLPSFPKVIWRWMWTLLTLKGYVQCLAGLWEELLLLKRLKINCLPCCFSPEQ